MEWRRKVFTSHLFEVFCHDIVDGGHRYCFSKRQLAATKESVDFCGGEEIGKPGEKPLKHMRDSTHLCMMDRVSSQCRLLD